MNTMAQLEFLRDAQVPAQRAWLESRHGALGAFRAANPAEAEAWNVRNRMFSLSNSLKAANGRLAALHTPEVMAKRADAERSLRAVIAERRELVAQYGQLFHRLAEIQQEKSRWTGELGAFWGLANRTYASATMRRALAAVSYLEERAGGAADDTLEALKGSVIATPAQPVGVERRLLEARFSDFARYLGSDHEVTRTALMDGSATASAASLLAHSTLASSESAGVGLEDAAALERDPAVVLARAITTSYRAYRADFARLTEEEAELAADLGRVRFEVYGRSVPPDATFSPRITDGVVKSYEYNGTLAPPYTTFYGLYDRYHAHRGKVDWALPARWTTPPAGLDLATPLNFVSTADTYGGNSGSPAVTPDLELVGLNFDRNIEGLSRDYIYLPDRGRNIMVDARAIEAALDHVYDADRIVRELLTGRLFRTEQEADRVGR
jgi:hypothetical protein